MGFTATLVLGHRLSRESHSPRVAHQQGQRQFGREARDASAEHLGQAQGLGHGFFREFAAVNGHQQVFVHGSLPSSIQD